MDSVVTQAYWDSFWEKVEPAYHPDVTFRDLFARYLKPGGTCFEIGCYPGKFLAYLCKTFNYEANGIDATPFVTTRLPAFLRRNGIRVGGLIHDDFVNYHSERTYDVVCSFGFLEHFADFGEVIEKHIDLVKESGTLILSCPNFRGVQHFLRKLLDPKDLERHVLRSMNFDSWSRILRRRGMELLFQGYYRTAGFWTSYQGEVSVRARTADLIAAVSDMADSVIDLPNPLTSPYMVSFSKKKSSV